MIDYGLPAIDVEALRHVFEAEAAEGLATMEAGLLRLEERPSDRETLAAVFRAAHTIKGSAGTFGLNAVGTLAHAVEDILDDLRDGTRPPTPVLITLLLGATDALRELVARGPQAPQELEGSHEELRTRLRAARRHEGEAAQPASGGGEDNGSLPQGGAPALARTLRIDTQRLDQLLSLTGEIAIARARLSQMIESPNVPRRTLQETQREAERLYLDLQDLVMRLRMVPVGPAFRQLARTVRDLAQSLGKEAHLTVEGDEVEVDNTMLQLLRDPLTHMVRNALDHGIEPPEKRTRRGKPRAGRIVLRCTRETGGILIELADDGAGIDRERILRRARERGLVGDEAQPSDTELLNLLFESGFSTAQEVSDVSGRGVGMDVVRRNIHALRGAVSLDSLAGSGTTVTIRLPLTLAIIEGLLVRVGETVCVLPLDEVEESLAVPADEARRGQARGVIRLRERALPYVRLRHLFQADGRPPAREVLIVVAGPTGPVGLVADAVTGLGQIVIKPLSKLFQNVRGIAATTVLGNGHVALIVDVAALLAGHIDEPVTQTEGVLPAAGGVPA